MKHRGGSGVDHEVGCSSCRRTRGTMTAERTNVIAHRLQRLARRQHSRGVTLVEVLIVVAIMALIAGGVSFLILPKYKEAQIKTARQSAQSIRQVATQYIALNSAEDCPTVQSLVRSEERRVGKECRSRG